MKPSLAGRVKGYKGPKTHRAIIRQIQKDLIDSHVQYRMSLDHIERVVRLFFCRIGVGHYFYHERNCYIKKFGYFRMIDRVYKHGAAKRLYRKKRKNKRINAHHARKRKEATKARRKARWADYFDD